MQPATQHNTTSHTQRIGALLRYLKRRNTARCADVRLHNNDTEHSENESEKSYNTIEDCICMCMIPTEILSTVLNYEQKPAHRKRHWMRWRHVRICT